MLGKFSVLGRPTHLDNSTAGAIALAVGTGGSFLDIFNSSIFSLFFLFLSGRRPDID